ncbi:MAG TPA: sugar ABC transporter ATP-binding protein [Spirochaetia bacterium]|nr:sugar ABC transporter ATP-binding protein [Spirochaetia bacterium]
MVPLVSMNGITKLFGPVKVLDRVDFSIYPGEVHILAGENGAGKSTLMKILAGAYADYQGRIEMEGRDIRPSSPLDANRHGIAAIHQELSLIPSMTVADNLFLGHPVTRSGFVREREHRRIAADVLSRAGVDVGVMTLVEDLPISVQQLIEITKAIRLNARVLIMDEPSSALNARDVETLFALVRQLKSENRGIVYITHRLEEIHRLADRTTVLRDGKLVGTALAPDLPEKKLIHWMVGREMEEQFPRHTPQVSSEALRVENMSVYKAGRAHRPLVDRVSLKVGQGEILGIGGLQGSGASEMFLGLFGALPSRTEGKVYIEGKPARIRSPRDAIASGVSLLTNDRKATGLISSMSVTANLCAASLGSLSRYGWRRPRAEARLATEMGRALQLRAASYDMEAGDLSGGNQQKVAIGKWLCTHPRIMLLDEPTRGIDVGAKHEIYQLMNEWTARGISILLVTSEMPELLAMSDRIIVMHRGRITAELSRQEATAEAVLEAAMGKTNGGGHER